MNIGFIGLGIMGKPMARNLIRAGHTLVVHDRHEENVALLTAEGARSGGSARGVAEGADVVVTMLPNSPHVKAAVLGDGGVIETIRPGAVVIDMSSIAPMASRELYDACLENGVRMLDAPVSGGEAGAIAGSLSVMVGGDREIFEAMRDDVLLKVGASAVYCGGSGSGNAVKLANQIIVAGNLAAMAEALTLAKRSGVDPRVVFDAVKGGLAGSAVLNAKAPAMLSGEFAPGFKLEHHIKDLANTLEAGHAFGSPLPLTAAVMEMLQTVRADGGGLDDHSAVAKWYAKVCGQAIWDR